MAFVFFNDTATTEIYTLSLHDALPISRADRLRRGLVARGGVEDRADPVERLRAERLPSRLQRFRDRKSTRLNSSHANISYAVFCLKKTYSRPYFRSSSPSHVIPLLPRT